MSLVDYASSSGEEEEEDRGARPRGGAAVEAKEEDSAVEGGAASPTETASPSVPSDFPPPQERRNQPVLRARHVESVASLPPPAPSVELPDASLLFASPSVTTLLLSGNDYSRVAAATADNMSRKRDSNGSASQFSQSKQPRRSIVHPKDSPDTSETLLPPQLRGRSNVVTEDIGRLFVKRRERSS